MIDFAITHPRAQGRPPFDIVGFLPEFWSPNDPAPAVVQADRAYAHGGGWNEFKGFTLRGWDADRGQESGPLRLDYPDDPPMQEVARATLRDELIVLFQHAWVAVIQPDGSMNVARMD